MSNDSQAIGNILSKICDDLGIGQCEFTLEDIKAIFKQVKE